MTFLVAIFLNSIAYNYVYISNILSKSSLWDHCVDITASFALGASENNCIPFFKITDIKTQISFKETPNRTYSLEKRYQRNEQFNQGKSKNKTIIYKSLKVIV